MAMAVRSLAPALIGEHAVAFNRDGMAQDALLVAGIVLKWVRADKEANYRRIEPLIRKAAAAGAQLVCTTECFLDGYAIADKSIPLPVYRALGEPIPDGPYYRRLAALAEELRIHLVAGMTEADGEARYNTAVLIGPDGGLIGRYHKQRLGHEAERNTAGTTSPVFTTIHGRIGLMICKDRGQSATARALQQGGADVILCLSGGMWGPVHNDPVLQARSRETGLPIVFVHPVEFLVTGADGSILDCTLVGGHLPARERAGDRLLVNGDQVGGEDDQAGVFYQAVPLRHGALSTR